MNLSGENRELAAQRFDIQDTSGAQGASCRKGARLGAIHWGFLIFRAAQPSRVLRLLELLTPGYQIERGNAARTKARLEAQSRQQRGGQLAGKADALSCQYVP